MVAGGLIVAAAADNSAALSLVVGGGIHLLGGMLMARLALRFGPDNDARSALGALVFGEVVKFVFTILLFTAALVAFQVRPGFMLTGYLLATIGYWLILLKG